MTHPTERLISCCGTGDAGGQDDVEIDELMVPIVKALWARGVHTCNGCCQGDPGAKAWIKFPDIGEADKFAHLYFGAYLKECHELRQAGQEPPLEERPVEGWNWSVSFRLPLMTRGTITVAFPYEQIDDVTRWLEASTPPSLDGLPTQPEQIPVFEYAGRTIADVMADPYPRPSPLASGRSTTYRSGGSARTHRDTRGRL